VAPVNAGDCMALFGYVQTPNTLNVTFIDSSTSSHTITTWHWDFGDGHSSNDHNISHTYSAPGTYEVCLTIHDNGDCNDTYCHAVVVLPVMPGDCVAFFTTEQTPGTLSVHFIDGSESNHEITSWLWTFGDGHSSDNHAPTHIYDTPGTYEVCLTIHDNTGCTSTYCHPVVVAAIPPGDCVALFTWYQIQGTQTIHFVDSSFSSHDITSYSWNFGDGHEGDGQNPNHYFPVGTYEVCLTIHDNTGCTDTYCTTVTVLPESPGECNALFSYEQISGTQNIHFTNLSTSDHDINSNFWSFGDGHNGDGQNPTHEYQNPGTYEVCLIIHDNTGCTDTFCLSVIVEPVTPGECQASFVWVQNSGTQTVHFESTSTSSHDIISYSWNFGDGHEGDGQNPSHYYPVGTYEVCLTIVDNTGCTDTYCDTITVEPEAPGDCMALFGYFQGENTLTIHFIDSSSSSHDITSWHWDFGDGHSSNDHNVTHTYLHAGTYEVCLTIHDNHECSDTYCTVVVVTEVEGGACHALFSFQHEEGSLNVHFTNASTSPDTIISWQWFFGDGSGSDDQNPSHTYAGPGTYHVCLVIHDNHGCVDEYCHDVTL
ncbi:MAG: PKD domain-containing protein, partial [Saprospiraceae bacterium]